MLASGSRSLGEPPGRVHRGESCAGSEPVHHPPRGDVPGLDEIISIFEPGNASSERVMDRLGFGSGSATVHPAGGLTQ